MIEHGTPEDGDLVGHQRHPVRAMGQRRSAVDAEELAVGIFEQIEIGGARLLLHDHGDVVEQVRELLRQLGEGVLDELLECVAGNEDHQPGMILNPKTRPVPGRWNGLAQ